jgi:hypothetical protein
MAAGMEMDVAVEGEEHDEKFFEDDDGREDEVDEPSGNHSKL